MSRVPRASGYFRTDYAQDFALLQTRRERVALALFIAALCGFPYIASAFYLDLACQVFLAAVGSLSLMLLTGYAGQVSLGHAGLLAAGAFTAGILFREFGAPFWITLPAAAAIGALLGVIFGLPSLRLRGLYLAISTLALYFVVVYIGGEYESTRGFSTGIMIDAPKIGAFVLRNPRLWYFVLLAAAALTLLACVNLLRSRTGRAWRAIRAHEVVAEALGIAIARYKLLAFVISSALASVAGALFAYYRGFVSVEAFSLFLSIQYIAMIIIGGMGSLRWRAARRIVRHALPLSDRSAAGEIAECANLCRRVVCRGLRRLRRGHDHISVVRTARFDRNLASRSKLLPVVAL